MVEASTNGLNMKKYLVHFRQHIKFFDFAKQELESLAGLYGVSKEQLYVNSDAIFDLKENPTIYVYLPGDETCHQIMSRSVLIKEIIDVFSEVQLERRTRRERSRDQMEENKTEDDPI